MHCNGSCVRSSMVLMNGITLIVFYLTAVVVWNFSAVLTRLLEVTEALWDQNSTDILFNFP